MCVRACLTDFLQAFSFGKIASMGREIAAERGVMGMYSGFGFKALHMGPCGLGFSLTAFFQSSSSYFLFFLAHSVTGLPFLSLLCVWLLNFAGGSGAFVAMLIPLCAKLMGIDKPIM